MTLELKDKIEAYERWTLVAQVQRVWTQNEFCYLYHSYYLFIYLCPSHYYKKNKKKCNSILGFHDERVWFFMVSKLFKYIFAFDHVCYKLLYDCPLLDCRNITLNMFAIMFFCLIINFNMMFSFWSLFYGKSVIGFYSKRYCCCSMFYNSFLKLR